MKTILVTGGAGFIGSNFIKLIARNYPDYRIINYDALTYAGNLTYLTDMEQNKNYIFVKGDIRDRNAIEMLFQKYSIDYVINFAAESHVDRSISDPEVFVSTNVLGTQVLLDVSKKYWKRNVDNH